jgi:hypothetical protein
MRSFPALLAGCFAVTMTLAAADDNAPPPGYDEGTRSVAIVTFAGAPVVIDAASVNLHQDADGKPLAANSACVRYRNVARENITSIRFERRYMNAAGKELGSDTIQDNVVRAPDPDAKPGVVPVGDAYWLCTQTHVAYGAMVARVVLFPILVTFSSDSMWRPPPDALR